MTPERRAEIRALLDGLTPGEWQHIRYDHGGGRMFVRGEHDGGPEGEQRALVGRGVPPADPEAPRKVAGPWRRHAQFPEFWQRFVAEPSHAQGLYAASVEDGARGVVWCAWETPWAEADHTLNALVDTVEEGKRRADAWLRDHGWTLEDDEQPPAPPAKGG